MKFKNPYWSKREQFELLEKWILVHACIYYRLSNNIVTDLTYDNNAKQLAKLMKDEPDAFRASRWYYAFDTFVASTGFDLYAKLSYEDDKKILYISNYLISMQEEDSKKEDPQWQEVESSTDKMKKKSWESWVLKEHRVAEPSGLKKKMAKMNT